MYKYLALTLSLVGLGIKSLCLLSKVTEGTTSVNVPRHDRHIHVLVEYNIVY